MIIKQNKQTSLFTPLKEKAKLKNKKLLFNLSLTFMTVRRKSYIVRHSTYF